MFVALTVLSVRYYLWLPQALSQCIQLGVCWHTVTWCIANRSGIEYEGPKPQVADDVSVLISGLMSSQCPHMNPLARAACYQLLTSCWFYSQPKISFVMKTGVWWLWVSCLLSWTSRFNTEQVDTTSLRCKLACSKTEIGDSAQSRTHSIVTRSFSSSVHKTLPLSKYYS